MSSVRATCPTAIISRYGRGVVVVTTNEIAARWVLGFAIRAKLKPATYPEIAPSMIERVDGSYRVTVWGFPRKPRVKKDRLQHD